MPPDAVVARVGARVGLIADHPQNLRATFCNNLALFLDGRSVYPVLCVTDGAGPGLGGFCHATAALDGVLDHGLLWKSVTAKSLLARAEESRKGFFDDDVFSALEGLEGEGFVRRGRTAEVDDVGRVAEGFEVFKGGDAGFAAEGFAALRRARGDSGDLNRDGVNAAQIVEMKPRCETGSDDANTNGVCHGFSAMRPNTSSRVRKIHYAPAMVDPRDQYHSRAKQYWRSAVHVQATSSGRCELAARIGGFCSARRWQSSLSAFVD